MRYEMLPCSASPKVKISTVDGDVQITGWERQEISAKTSGDELKVTQDDDKFTIASNDDLIVYLPCGSELDIDSVSGDMDLRVLEKAVVISNVGGDLQANGTCGLTVDSVGGDFSARAIQGDCRVSNVGRDVSLTTVSGQVSLGGVGADLYVRDVDGSLSAQASADAVLFINPAAGGKYSITAGSTILLRLPVDASAKLNLVAGGMDAIRIDFPGVEADDVQSPYQFTLGKGEAVISLVAGADIIITHNAEEWQAMADFGPEAWGARDFPGVPPVPPIPTIPGVPGGLAEKISGRINEKLAGRMKDVERRTEAAMRRAEQKIRAAEHRRRFSIGSGGRKHVNVNFGGQPATPPGEPVSDDERLAILKMLQEKKISLQDAEKLLAALDGK
jgi:hypothetical protein